MNTIFFIETILTDDYLSYSNERHEWFYRVSHCLWLSLSRDPLGWLVPLRAIPQDEITVVWMFHP